MAEKAQARPARRSRMASLNREQAVYEANVARWVKKHECAHVLIKGGEVVGFYETRDEALSAGYERFGVVPLFVKQIAASEPIYYMPNVLL